MTNGNISIYSRQFLYDVIYPVYYFVHGSIDNERTTLESKNIISKKRMTMHRYFSSFLSKAKQDASAFVATKVMFAFHMLIVNILLINLLIALFRYVK